MTEKKATRKRIRKRIKLPSLNKMKLVLAIVMLIAEIVAIIGSSMYGFQVGAVSLVFFVIITFDYIRVIRAEMKEGPWYEIEDIEGT